MNKSGVPTTCPIDWAQIWHKRCEGESTRGPRALQIRQVRPHHHPDANHEVSSLLFVSHRWVDRVGRRSLPNEVALIG